MSNEGGIRLMPIENGNAIDMAYKSDKAQQRVRGDGYKPTPKPANTVPSRTFGGNSNGNWARGTYQYGDGDTPVYIRPGALDYKDKPSRGQK